MAATAAALAVALLPGASSPSGATPERISVIVRETPGAGDVPEALVEKFEGRVGRHIRIIDGFIAEVPASRLDDLRASDSIYSVTRNRRVELLGAGGEALSVDGVVYGAFVACCAHWGYTATLLPYGGA